MNVKGSIEQVLEYHPQNEEICLQYGDGGLRKKLIKLSALPQHTLSIPSISHALYLIPHLKNEAQYGLHKPHRLPKKPHKTNRYN